MSKPRILIAPSLLAADFAHLADEIGRVEAGGADMLHLDVMDGHFVPNISFGLPVVESVRKVTALPLDTHLMISDAARFVGDFASAGSTSLTVHLESYPDPRGIIDAIRDQGLGCALVINPATPATELLPHLGRIDMALVMSVEPGFGGQEFQPVALDKVRCLRAHLDRSGESVRIQIDGGINPQTARLAREAGVDVLVAGSAIFRAPDPAAALEALRG